MRRLQNNSGQTSGKATRARHRTEWSWLTGRPPADPFFFRLAVWSIFSGITVLIRRLRRWARLPREEVLPAATASGWVRGRPTGPRTRNFFSAGTNRGLSAAWPVVSTHAGGRHLRAAVR